MIITRYSLTERLPVLISPVFGVVSPRDAARWILQSGAPLRLNMQLHKYIWGPEARGV
jgi:7-carboxy-7-deazaguanine synthase